MKRLPCRCVCLVSKVFCVIAAIFALEDLQFPGPYQHTPSGNHAIIESRSQRLKKGPIRRSIGHTIRPFALTRLLRSRAII